jgi:hypothetical protein
VKKAIMVLGYLFLVLIVVLIVGYGTLTIIGHRLDRESKVFVDAAIPAIVSNWGVNEIEKRASPEFNEEMDYDGLEQDLGALQRQLGKLVEYKGSAGDSNITLSLQYGYEVTADYTASADFETGSADIQMSLIKHGGQWQILDLKINPEEFNERSDII